jgi:hypothetical protein
VNGRNNINLSGTNYSLMGVISATYQLPARPVHLVQGLSDHLQVASLIGL